MRRAKAFVIAPVAYMVWVGSASDRLVRAGTLQR
ncbi:MAG: hypothetical protein JWP65_1753 [Ramlibacter sp.]|jgi:hypothetical protein|nr:hypothetical protein [Ramlibacter sp.]